METELELPAPPISMDIMLPNALPWLSRPRFPILYYGIRVMLYALPHEPEELSQWFRERQLEKDLSTLETERKIPKLKQRISKWFRNGFDRPEAVMDRVNYTCIHEEGLLFGGKAYVFGSKAKIRCLLWKYKNPWTLDFTWTVNNLSQSREIPVPDEYRAEAVRIRDYFGQRELLID